MKFMSGMPLVLVGIKSDSCWGLVCFAPVDIPIRNGLREGGIVIEATSGFLFLLSIMVGGFAGLLMNLPALPNFQSINIPQIDCWFTYNILDITKSGLSCGLDSDMKPVSVALYIEKPISGLSISSPICQVVYF